MYSVAVLKILKTLIYRKQYVQVRLWLINDCSKIKVYTSELLNLSVDFFIDLLPDKSNLSSPYRSAFAISSSCLFKMILLIFLI